MVYILLILLFMWDKINSFKDQTKKIPNLHCLQSFSGLRRNARSEQETREYTSATFWAHASFVFSWNWRVSQWWERCFLYFLNMKKLRDHQNFNLCSYVWNFNLSCHHSCHLLSFSNHDPSAYASDSSLHAEKSSRVETVSLSAESCINTEKIHNGQ